MDYDDKLAQLMSLGFELDLCQSALSHTTTVESATEWYVHASACPLPLMTVITRCRILNALDNPETSLQDSSLSQPPRQLSEEAQKQRVGYLCSVGVIISLYRRCIKPDRTKSLRGTVCSLRNSIARAS